ncbi:MAG: M20/M25/M40 family metallo-hydrolase [Anaerolineae bacterium]
MNIIERIAGEPAVQSALASFHDELTQIIETIVAIQQIPAPTFAEGERARFIEKQFAGLGLEDVSRDGIENVYGRFPGTDPAHPPVIISAHSDTVFPAETDLAVKRNGRFLYGPGIADNSAGVAGLLHLARSLHQHRLTTAADLWFVANVGEEGLGDLRGMRAVVDRFGKQAQYLIVEGGLYGQIVHQGIGVRRYRIQANAPGGHSWGSFGAASAIHELGHLIAAIDGLVVPHQPRTTYNVGQIGGGTSINTIAQSAHLLLDLRSEDAGALAKLVAQVEELVMARDGRTPELTFIMEPIGNRPPGRIQRDAPLVQAAAAALRAVGCREVEFVPASTDANVPLSAGATAVCIGLAQSANAHRLDEYLDTSYLPKGLGQLLLLVLAVGGYQSTILG